MRKTKRTILVSLLAVQFAGCSMLPLNELSTTSLLRLSNSNSSDSQSEDSLSEGKVANPPATTMRFDGHEIVLGEAESRVLDTEQFVSKLQPMVQAQRLHSATTLILRHREASERMLAERWARGLDDEVVQLAAQILSRRSNNSKASWNSLIELAKSNAGAADQYQQLRNSFAEQLQVSDPSNEAAEKLMQASAKLAHPLVRVDALRLVGLRDLVAGRYAWAESHFRQAIEMSASSGNNLLAAELWLMVAETARRSDQHNAATEAWSKAVNMHLAAYKNYPILDVSFWNLAEKTRPEPLPWPPEVGKALASHIQPLGCSSKGGSEMVLWIAVAQAQMDRGEYQMALVNFKRAETLARDSNVMWLRIAQARCLAAMGQTPAAAAILSGPAASPDATLAAAATATMGSIKLMSGAFQQGAQLLHKATTQSPELDWPMKNQALVNLAIAQLIIGDTDTGLDALHQVQVLLEQSGDRQLLLQTLENELRLLEFEELTDQSSKVKRRIAQLERL